MDLDSLPWDEAQQIRELQAILMDWREGKVGKLKPAEQRLFKAVEHLVLRVLASEDE